jgi:hypothetical protein
MPNTLNKWSIELASELIQTITVGHKGGTFFCTCAAVYRKQLGQSRPDDHNLYCSCPLSPTSLPRPVVTGARILPDLSVDIGGVYVQKIKTE